MLTTPTELKKRVPQGALVVFKARKSDKTYYMARKKPKRPKAKPKNFVYMETDFDFLHKYNVVKEYILKRDKIPVEYLEMFFYLNHITIFTTQDYNDILFFGKKPSIAKLKKEGWVEKYVMDIKRPVPIYTLSKKAQMVSSDFHKMLLDINKIICPYKSSVVTRGMRGSNKQVILSKFKEIMG